MWKDLKVQLEALRSPAPDWPIRELFFHIRPDLLDGPPEERWWERVGQDVADKFATGQVHVWGRPQTGNPQSPLRLISSDYWEQGMFTYSFLAEGTEVAHASGIIDVVPYHDLRVNRAEAMCIWPSRRTI